MPSQTGPANGAHLRAIANWSSVRLAPIAFTSASAARYSADPNAGGGDRRSSLPDVRKNGRAPNPPVTIGAPLLTQ